jgi:hypothetical protein
MNLSKRSWPPLVIANRVPLLVKWRDLFLTSILWAGFLVMVDNEFEIVLNDFLGILGFRRGRGTGGVNWTVFIDRLTPFLVAAAVLAGLLMILGVRTRRRWRRVRLLSRPASPLEVAAEARRAGIDEAVLIAARDLKIAIVHVEAGGKARIEPVAVGT